MSTHSEQFGNPPHPIARELTIVVPAFNEALQLPNTIAAIGNAARRHLARHEIIIVNDGSTDATARVADELARTVEHVRAVHFPHNRGVGAAYRIGLEQATCPFITLVPGDNAFAETALDEVFQAVGKAQLVVSYRVNMRVRTPVRRVLSVLCTTLMRIVTGRPIRDAHSMYVFPVEMARAFPVQPGYGYHIESLGKLLSRGLTYVEVPAVLNAKPDASSGVMRLRVLWLLGITIVRLALWRCGVRQDMAAKARGAGESDTVTGRLRL